MSKAKILIESDSIASTEVSPVWKGDFQYERERDQVFYRHKLNSEMKFTGVDYTLISEAPECELITLTVQIYCGGDWIDYWQGTFTKYDCKFDLDRCELRVKPDVIDSYTCMLRDWDEKTNIYGVGTPTVVRPFGGIYEAGIHCCNDLQPTPDPCNDWSSVACIEFSTAIEVGVGGGWQVKTCWHRIIGTGTPTEPPPYSTGWTLLSGSTWWRCPDDQEVGVGALRYGRVFNSILSYVLEGVGCGLTLRSHFFDINATHEPAPPSNTPYTFAIEKLQKMTLHQKSDIKRPDSSDPSRPSVWFISAKDLLEDLRIMFNVYWAVIGDDLVVEHQSYFEALTGADYSAQKIASRYEADADGAPRVELWKWMDDVALSTAHRGYPIIYNCGEGEKENRVRNFTNDIGEIEATANAEFVTDAGFVLIANQVVDGAYVVLELNDPLGWVQLHENLHRHGRYFIDGNMNDADTTFETAKRVKKLSDFTVKSCCDEAFSPLAIITTPAGEGEVKQATQNIFKNTLQLDLLI